MSRFLNYVELSKEEKSELESIMILGSSSLIECTGRFFNKTDKATRIEFLELLFSGEIERMIDDKSLKNNFFTLLELSSIWEIRANEVRMLQGYSKSLVKIHFKYNKKFRYLISGVGINDDMLETTIIDNARLSMYFFDNRGTKFHTFMYLFVNNAVTDLIKRLAKKSKLNYVNESQLSGDPEKTGNVFKINSLAKKEKLYTRKDIALLYEAIKQADLSEIEHELIMADLSRSEFDTHSERVKFVDQILEVNRNPKNGKKYCKQQSLNMIERAKEKIKNKYNELLIEIEQT